MKNQNRVVQGNTMIHMKNIIFVDLDGTLTPQSTWLDLNMILGLTPVEDQDLFSKWIDEKITYHEWMNEIMKIYKSRKEVSQDEIAAYSKTIILREDAHTFVETLRQRGFHTVLLSGSIDTIVRVVANELGFDEWVACARGVYNDKGILTDIQSSGNEGPAKLSYARSICAGRDVDIHNAFAVGDGGNDQLLFQASQGIMLGDNTGLRPYAWKQAATLTDCLALFD